MKRCFWSSILIGIAAFGAFAQSFPEKCLGIWKGTMEIYSRGEIKDRVDVRLTVARTKTPSDFTWRTEYLSRTRPMTKDYVMRVLDVAKGLYETDEGEGLKLTEYLFGNKLFNVFEVQGVMLTSSYELREDELIFEVTSGKKVGTVAGGVTNFSVDNLQRVVFKREK